MPLAALSLVFGTALAGLTADGWAVRASSHDMLVDCGPLGMAVAAAGARHRDAEVAFRCGQAAEGRRPRVMPVPWVEWEPWPKGRLR